MIAAIRLAAYTAILVLISLATNTISFFAFQCCTMTKDSTACTTVPVKEKSTPLTDYRGKTNWGTVEQDVDKLTFTGHSHWYAEGHIQKDGKVFLLWIENDGRRAISLYDQHSWSLCPITGAYDHVISLEGAWGYEEYLEVKDGILVRKEGHEDRRIPRDTIRWRK